jgi:HD-like signal output (HDOD) protein
MGEIRGIEAWTELLLELDLPMLDAVVKEICELSENDKCRADDLTRIILRDADLTTKVLKIANSVHYNPSFIAIKTVSRAIVQLGFDNLRNITLTTALINNFLKGAPKTLLIQSLARSFHAAVQAKAMVPYLDGEQKEQVFIAALLRNISELALITSSRPVVEEYLLARDQEPEAERRIALEYLGVDTNLLSRNLIKDWALGELLREACDTRGKLSEAARAVNLGNEISRYIHRGMNSPQMDIHCEETAKLCGISVAEAHKQILLMADEASIIAKTYGIEVIISALPDPNELVEKTVAQPPSEYVFQQQLNQLNKMLLAGEEASKITQLAVAALHKGVGAARAALAPVDYKTKTLDIRYVAGKSTHLWRQQIKINLGNLHKGELLHEFLCAQQPLWYQPNCRPKTLGALEVLVVKGDIFLAPILLNKRLVALLYADAEGGQFCPRQFEEFQILANLLNLMMKMNAVSS